MDLHAALRTIDQILAATPRAVAAATALATAAAVHAQQPVLFVDAAAAPGGDGRSWAGAMRDIQDALAAGPFLGNSGLIVKIAQGTYTPDRGTMDRTRSFSVTSGVTLMGGFAGSLGAAMGIDPGARDIAGFATILSGDLGRNDTANFGNRADNSRHVVDASSAHDAFFDGLTITGGYAVGADSFRGGGAVLISAPNRAGRVFFNECALKENAADLYGGAIGGSAGTFGYVYITRSTLQGNRVIGSGSGFGGGAIAASQVVLRRSIVRDNSSSDGGGAVLVDYRFAAESTLFAGNRAAGLGGALQTDFTQVTLYHCTFVANTARRGAVADGLFLNGSGSNEVAGNIFSGNINTEPNAYLFNISRSSVPFRYNLVNEPVSTIGESFYVIEPNNVLAAPEFADADGPDNNPTTFGDNDYSLRFGSPGIDAVLDQIEPADDTDLIGSPRRDAGGCACRAFGDMGCYELAAGSCTVPPARIFVRTGAAPGGDGRSWSTAFSNLTSALRVPAVVEIWITAGTYRAPAATTPPLATDRDATIEVGCAVTIRGGFTGTETSLDQRPPTISGPPTVFSGDLLGNDTPDFGNRTDNTKTMFTIDGRGATLERLTIERSASENSGNGRYPSAVLIEGGDATLIDCVIRDCASDYAPAIRATDASLRIDRCRIERNASIRPSVNWGGRGGGAITLRESLCEIIDTDFLANRVEGTGSGGAILSENSVLVVVGSRFRDNLLSSVAAGAYGGSACGGAIFASAWDAGASSRLSLVNCTFTRNSVTNLALQSTTAGGAIGGNGGTWSLVGCLFAGNSAFGLTGASGGAVHSADQPVTFTNCTFANNTAEGWFNFGRVGGISWNSTSRPTVSNCILWGNRDDVSSGSLAQIGAPPGTPGQATITRSIIQGWPGGGTPDPRGNINTDPRLTPDFRLDEHSPAIDRADSRLFPLADITTDAAGAPRLFDDPATANTGLGAVAYLDLGAYEYQGFVCRVDLNNSGGVDSGDLFVFLADWFSLAPRADFNRDTRVTLQDLFDFLAAYLAGCP